MAGERVGTGIPNLDKLIEGGFKQGSINLVAGNAGSGKTTMAMQFIMDGLKKGEPAVFVSLEETKEKIFADFIEFGWDLEQYERNGLLRFLEYGPDQIGRLVAEGGGTLDVMITQINAKRLVLDSISSFSGVFSSRATRRSSSMAFFDLIYRWGCTALVTSQATKVDADDIEAELEFEVDGIIVLHHFKKKGERERAIEILKMRGTKIPEKTMKMTLSSKGIDVEPTKVVSI
ncbi:MAG: ATPase domain-containing protein [Nanoarchaeota archaeon]|nr:ATPase domain-containing protein [Nanoarchaeota archaeon]